MRRSATVGGSRAGEILEEMKAALVVLSDCRKELVEELREGEKKKPATTEGTEGHGEEGEQRTRSEKRTAAARSDRPLHPSRVAATAAALLGHARGVVPEGGRARLTEVFVRNCIRDRWRVVLEAWRASGVEEFAVVRASVGGRGTPPWFLVRGVGGRAPALTTGEEGGEGTPAEKGKAAWKFRRPGGRASFDFKAPSSETVHETERTRELVRTSKLRAAVPLGVTPLRGAAKGQGWRSSCSSPSSSGSGGCSTTPPRGAGTGRTGTDPGDARPACGSEPSGPGGVGGGTPTTQQLPMGKARKLERGVKA